MKELKNTLESKILSTVNIHGVIGEVKLYDLIRESDSNDSYRSYNEALNSLINKGLIKLSIEPKTQGMFLTIKRLVH